MIKRKNIIILGSLLALVTAYLILTANSSPAENKNVRLIMNGKSFNAEIVDNPQAREKGLGGRSSLCEDCGMLFVFEKRGEYPFWMKGMEFSIDIIWIDGREIVYIAGSVPPESKEVIRPGVFADKVFEISAGQAEKLNLKKGDKIDLK